MTGEPLVVSVLGWSGSGKTTFIAHAIEECRRRGITVAAVKRARHAPDIALEGKDSTLYLKAGARSSLYVGDESMAQFEITPPKLDREFFLRRLDDVDMVFLEGAEVEGCLRILLAGAAESANLLKRPPQECDLLLATSPKLAGELPGTKILHPEAIAEILDYLEVRREE